MTDNIAYIDALLDVQTPSDAQLSPDGGHIAYVFGVIHKPDAETPHPSVIHILNLGDGRSHSLDAASTGYEPRTTLVTRWATVGLPRETRWPEHDMPISHRHRGGTGRSPFHRERERFRAGLAFQWDRT